MKTILDRLINKIEVKSGSKITVRTIAGGHSKGDTGIYVNNVRRFVCVDRKEVISRLVFMGS